MSEEPQNSGTFETEKDAGKGSQGLYRLWMSALKLSEKTEKDWTKAAINVNKRFRDEEKRKGARFNILYANVQTQEPALYNSTPVPDVRRRFNDADKTGKVAAQVFERGLSFCVDDYDMDSPMKAIVHDSGTVGRGVGYIEYSPKVVNDQIVDQSVMLKHAQWDDFRHGPAKTWSAVPWVALRFRITREKAIKLNPKIGSTVTLDYTEAGSDEDKDSKDVPSVFKRLTVWKIWDKPKRRILFIAPSYKEGPFAIEEDTLGLEDFFPFPKPVYDIEDPNSLIPLIPFNMYRDQAEELDNLTRRIKSLISVLRWRGIRPSQIEELDRLKDADDGELIPSQSFDALVMTQGARPDQAIWLMPIDKLIQVIRELVIQREQVKQVVFELSGLADVMRGDTDPNETLGAQQLKAQWGSMRMQSRQREVQRFARDIIRLKAEIIGEKFTPEILSLMTGVKIPTDEQKQQAQQAIAIAQQTQQQPPPEILEIAETPSWGEVKAVMGSDQMRSYRIDIETDSTIQADNLRSQANMSAFAEGLASFANGIGPAVQAGIMPVDVVSDILTGFARNFKLGKQAEDAIERWGEESKEPKPDPQQQAQAQQQQAEAQDKEAERQIEVAEKTAAAQQKAGELQLKGEQLEFEREKFTTQMALEEQHKSNADVLNAITALAELVAKMQPQEAA